MEPEQRTAVVTGSSRGIGKAIAVRLLGEGYKVVLNYSTNDELAAAALAECQRISPEVLLIKADISKPQGAALLAQRAVDAFGTLDVLVNNAARVIDRPVLEMTEGEWDDVVDTNLKGPFLCAQQAARHMLIQGHGIILNIGASTGIRGRTNGANTCASKAGLMLLTQCLALELGPAIRVNTVIPGMTVTEETTRRFGLDDPAVRAGREATIPLGRLGRPEDIADVVLLLLSNEARFVSGQRIVVDGGQYMW